jgi:hypothetical protein
MPIQFVSAGHLEGTLKERIPDVELAQAEASDSSAESVAPSSPSSTPDTIEAMAHMAIRSPSPALSEASSSSADEVLFRGRGAQPVTPVATSSTTHAPKATPAAKQPVSPRHAADRLPQDGPKTATQSSRPRESLRIPTPQLTAAFTTNDRTAVAETEHAQTSVELSIRVNATSEAEQEVDSDTNEPVQDRFAKRRGGKPAWEGKTTEWQHRSRPGLQRPGMDAYLRGEGNPRDAAMDDYMQNVEDFGLTDDVMAGASGFARREMDLDAGSHNDWESASGSQADNSLGDFPGDSLGDFHVDSQGEGSDNWDSDMLQDFEDMSTSSEVMEAVVRILAKRIRKSGLHYLCVYDGSVTDDARWLPETFLKSAEEKRMIKAFEAEVIEREQQMFTSGDSTDEDEEEEEDEDMNGEELDDETLARVLQKQEELGLGSDEMMLYGADTFFGSPAPANFISFGGSGWLNKKRQGRVRGNRDPSFPSASAMADAVEMDPYGAFDIMDTERPSLKPKKKGRRGQPPAELEDSDLNEQIQTAWAADRAKKRLKKAEREELRQQGLLGRKGKSPNLKVKYKGGIVMEDIVEELREFLLGDLQTLSLPPMEAHRRATVHQAAAQFKLSSRSRGDGTERFTVLSKTMHTREYTDAEFDKQIQKKGFQKRLRGPLHTQGGGGGRAPRFSTVKHGARGSRPQLGYKDGETVGADAPELGPENKGHALMMKMGWSKGTALGLGDNKGILQPIPHVVKTNKAGLQ